MAKKKGKKKSHVKHVHVKPEPSSGLKKFIEVIGAIKTELAKPENQQMLQEKLMQTTQLRKEKFEKAVLGSEGTLPLFQTRDETDENVVWSWLNEEYDYLVKLIHIKNENHWQTGLRSTSRFTPDVGKAIAEALLSAHFTMENYIRDNPPKINIGEANHPPAEKRKLEAVKPLDDSEGEVENKKAEQVGVVFDPNAFVPGPDPQKPPWMPGDPADDEDFDDDDYPLGESPL